VGNIWYGIFTSSATTQSMPDIPRDQFDVIIVGAGSAGCVLAARLSEDLARRVLLLEAGPPDRSWRINMPAAVGSLLSSERFNWNYVSDSEPHLDGRRLSHPRGRVLGGSSSINGMVYVRGHAHDYDGWAAQGLSGWSYAEVLPFFKRAERHLHGEDAYHGASGPLAVCAPDLDRAPLAASFVRAGEQAGYGAPTDVNGERQEGFGRIDRTTFQGRRWSAARAYLDAAATRRNLTIRTEVRVCRLLLDGQRATGVEYSDRSGVHQVKAEGEVIVAAGAINSPQLLQLSGIGPARLLRKFDIAVRCELPAVGENLNDHPDIVIQHRCLQPVSLFGANRRIAKLLAGLRWFAGIEGVAGSNHFEAGAFLRSRAGIETPDIQLTFMPLAIKPGTVEDVGEHSFQVHIDLLRPRSLGRVAIRSQDPVVAPSICFNYLADPEDRTDLRAAVRLTREILAQPALDHVRGQELSPGAAVTSDADIDAWIRQCVETCYHPVGSCRMGLDPRTSVVDAQGRVHGVRALRVVDASIMPSIVSGNTNAPVIMMAEKISADILGMAPPAQDQPAVWIHPRWASEQR
jgi:choline dehydrogenase